MDLIFKRYSSPFFIIDTLIANCQFYEFINTLIDTVNEEKIYELWLHKVYTLEYNDFRSQFNIDDNSEEFDIVDVVKTSMSVLEDIQP